MTSGSSSQDRADVVIAGGGVAALEAALALRALSGDRVRMTLVCPDRALTFRPSAAFEAFGQPVPPRYDLEAIARNLGAGFCAARVEAVAPRTRVVRLGSGMRLEYDALILAIGARATASIPGATTFYGQRGVPQLRRVQGELESGALGRLILAVPSGSTWAMPLYELALLSAARAQRTGAGAEIVLVSPERRPLEVFGADASAVVEDELAARGVRFIGDAPAVSWRNGALAIQDGAPIRADRVITLPHLRVNRLASIPARSGGFVPTDALGRVEGLTDVYAAGDMTTYPVKQGGLATQQADRAAHTIAALLGAPVKKLRVANILRARLLGGAQPLLLRTELDWQGRPVTGEVELGELEGVVDGSKVFGRYLTPYLEELGRGTPLAA